MLFSEIERGDRLLERIEKLENKLQMIIDFFSAIGEDDIGIRRNFPEKGWMDLRQYIQKHQNYFDN